MSQQCAPFLAFLFLKHKVNERRIRQKEQEEKQRKERIFKREGSSLSVVYGEDLCKRIDKPAKKQKGGITKMAKPTNNHPQVEVPEQSITTTRKSVIEEIEEITQKITPIIHSYNAVFLMKALLEYRDCGEIRTGTLQEVLDLIDKISHSDFPQYNKENGNDTFTLEEAELLILCLNLYKKKIEAGTHWAEQLNDTEDKILAMIYKMGRKEK